MSIRVILPDGTEERFNSPADLREAVAEGYVPSDALVFQAGENRWVPVSDHPGFASRSVDDPVHIDDSSDVDMLNLEQSGVVQEPDAGSGGKTGKTWPPVKVLSWLSIVSYAFFWASRSTGESGAYMVGAFLGGVVSPFLFAGIFLVWSKRTRPYILRAAGGLALVMLFGLIINEHEDQVAEEGEIDQIAAILQDSVPEPAERAGTYSPPTVQGSSEGIPESSGTTGPPLGSSSETRILWTIRKTLQDGFRLAETRTSALSEELGELPSDWLEPRYLANASGYPEVERFFRRGELLVDEMRNVNLPLYDSLFRHYGQRARLSESALESGLEGFRKGVRQGAPIMDSLATVTDRMFKSGLSLHQYLEEVDSRVHYDRADDMARFELESERLRASNLIMFYQNTAMRFQESYSSLYASYQQRVATGLDSMRNMLGQQ